MKIREFLQARNAMPPIVEVPMPGVGMVRVRRVSAMEGGDFATGFDAVAATVVDEQDQPLFKNGVEARAADWAVIRMLNAAYDRANRIDLEDAAKN